MATSSIQIAYTSPSQLHPFQSIHPSSPSPLQVVSSSTSSIPYSFDATNPRMLPRVFHSPSRMTWCFEVLYSRDGGRPVTFGSGRMRVPGTMKFVKLSLDPTLMDEEKSDPVVLGTRISLEPAGMSLTTSRRRAVMAPACLLVLEER